MIIDSFGYVIIFILFKIIVSALIVDGHSRQDMCFYLHYILLKHNMGTTLAIKNQLDYIKLSSHFMFIWITHRRNELSKMADTKRTELSDL